MTIKIINKPQEQILQSINKIYEDRKLKESDLPKTVINEIKNLFNNTSIKKFMSNLDNIEFYDNFCYESLAETHEITKLFYEKVNEIKKEVDIEIFFKEGYQIDQKELRRQAKKKGILKEFPKFSIKRLAELYKNPPKKIYTYYDKDKYILIDEFVYRKFLIGINQMIFNHMDLLICSIGAEGAGKSNHTSQDILMMHWTLKEIGIIDYPFDIKEMAFNTLQKFREAEDKYFHEPFRLLWLDEGNELHRQDWRDEEVKTFFQRLRRERHNRRIKFISLPVLGEMITNIIISRMNFIFDMVNRNELKTATLHKGEYDFYIIPRGSKIYSPYHKKNLKREDVKNTLFANIKNNEYLKGMPKSIIIKKCFCNGTWGFREKQYIKELKESNKTFTVTKGVSLTPLECFYIYKLNLTMKKLDVERNDIRYHLIFRVLNRIRKKFEDDPDMMLRYEAIYERKLQENKEKEKEKKKVKG